MATALHAGDELAYALVTPYSIHKSRNGGILARLLWADVRLVAARMYAPDPQGDFIERYCDSIYDPEARSIPLHHQRRIIEYVLRNFGRSNMHDISNRLMLLVFAGPNAQQEVLKSVGNLNQPVRGDNVRGTYGENVQLNTGDHEYDEAFMRLKQLQTRYPALQNASAPDYRGEFFEPAVFTGPTPELTEAHLKLFSECAYTDGGYVAGAVDDLNDPDVETTMVIFKPESFAQRDPMPGNLMDFFSRTGMRITGCKVMQMTVEQAREFYALKVPQFQRVLKGMVEEHARTTVKRARVLTEQARKRLDADAHKAMTPDYALDLVEKADQVYSCPQGPGDLKPPVVERLYKELRKRLTSLNPDESLYEELAEDLKGLNAEVEFNELISYMSGKNPQTGEDLVEEGDTRCLALLYSGKEAFHVIRKRLKQLREVYAENVLVNRAHASDPGEDPQNEVRILGMPNSPDGESQPCDVEQVVRECYGDTQ
jgi:nucleoside diphosphate kinase